MFSSIPFLASNDSIPEALISQGHFEILLDFPSPLIWQTIMASVTGVPKEI